ncbi:phage antirepressor KilAC domain-containing protein [Pseudomonas anguilliseptica]|uniref:phage antirepressor KilAC domain-containing protein n=1 Tax=Pseudomonas anguilliseptica TaxID=53406 RepID=UPI00325A7CC1
MNRTLNQAAQVLGIRETALRVWLRDQGHLNKDGTLAAKHVGAGKLFMEPRVTQPKQLGHRKHYAVLMVTKRGIDWLAAQMGIEIKEIPQKDTAA